jgi:DNA primase
MDDSLTQIKTSVLERVNVVDLIGRRLPLTKRGANHFALCPFHDEKTPSLSVSASLQRFKCFGCNEGGNAIDFIMKYEGHDFMTSLKALGDEVGVDVCQGLGERKPSRLGLSYAPRIRLEAVRQPLPPIPIDEETMDWYENCQDNLSHPMARQYLAKRKIDFDIAKSMGLGFSEKTWVDGRDAPRLIFPQRRPDGAIVGLYGRRTDGRETYKHRKLTDNIDGVFNAPAMLNKTAPLWVTEGVFDAMALRCAGFPNVVALFGLANIRWGWMVGRKDVILAIDHDKAGQSGVERFRREAMMYGVALSQVTPEELGGAKDISQAWEDGSLSLSL